VTADQLTYVLAALLVAGLAILLLLVGVLLGRRAGRPAASLPSAAPAPPAYEQVVPEQRPATATWPGPPPAPAPGEPVMAEAPAEPAGWPAVGPAGEPVAAEPVGEPVAAEPAVVTAADLAAAAARVHDPREEEVIEGFLSIAPRRREAGAAEAPAASWSAAAEPPAGRFAPDRRAEFAGQSVPPPDPFTDDATGLDSRLAWDRAAAEENARYLRYRRPVSVVVAELDGLARFEDQFGAEAGERVLRAVGGTLRRNSRRTDRVAHAGGGRFLVLLPETDEIQAINYVERVRGECERWLEAGAVTLHLSLGWASPSAVGELDTALRAAEERMYGERRRMARAANGEAGPSR
jgi:diguanylate cyclase (GGDEF)-like protein